jgi:phosphoglycolate phosphatase
MKYSLIIFDFDGTLADTFPWFARVINKVADKYKFKKVSENDHELLRGLGAREIFKYLGIPLWKTPMIGKYISSLLSQDIHKISLFDGIDGLLKSLSMKNVTIAVLSTNSFTNISAVLGSENTALIDHFECGVSALGKRAKLRKILKKSRIPPSETIFIGDEIRDCEAANKAGVAFGAVSWGYTRIDSLESCKPTEVFTSVDQISDKLLSSE